jgi:3-deoxy-manno-octulosonate cytidylyltransferase (CMP-KDO synthetase)
MKVVAAIPARMESARLPNKPLLNHNDKPLIVYTIEAVRAATSIDRVVVVTDSSKIEDASKHYCDTVFQSEGTIWCGTDRIYRAMKAGLLDGDLVLNVQCDEPCISAEDLNRLVDHTKQDGSIATLIAPLRDIADLSNRDIVKANVEHGRCVAFARQGWFSRPYHHIGVYAFARQSLYDVGKLNQTQKSRKLRLEQVTWLDHGFVIDAVTVTKAPLSINSQADYERFVSMC